jgi:hypothetical protein
MVTNKPHVTSAKTYQYYVVILVRTKTVSLFFNKNKLLGCCEYYLKKKCVRKTTKGTEWNKKFERQPYRFKIKKQKIALDIVMRVDVFRQKVTYIEAGKKDQK